MKREGSCPINSHKAQMHLYIRSHEIPLYPFLLVLPCIPCNQTKAEHRGQKKEMAEVRTLGNTDMEESDREKSQ